jgi:pimeloyl-[acyl-carrier protein] methyl ester esterase
MNGDVAILLPGLDGTGDLLDDFAAGAPRGTECLVMRYPTDKMLGYAALTDFVLERIPADRPVMLIAESFSGPIAARVAERLGDQVVALVFCNSFVTPPRSPLLRFLARTAVFRIRLPKRILAAIVLDPLSTPELESAIDATIRKVEPAVFAGRVRELLTVDDRPTLRRVQAPILYLRGTRDRLVPDKALLQITQAVPSARVHRIPAPHALFQTAAAEAWAAIGTFTAHRNARI